MEGGTVCGGGDYTNTTTTCLTLTQDEWQTSASLIERRYWHSSWASPSGLTILMGGGDSPETTEKIQEDGTSVRSFDLDFSLM